MRKKYIFRPKEARPISVVLVSFPFPLFLPQNGQNMFFFHFQKGKKVGRKRGLCHFYFFSSGEGGVRGARKGRGSVFIEKREGGGGSPTRGVGVLPREGGREGACGELGGGGGAKYSFSGPKCPPSLCVHALRWGLNYGFSVMLPLESALAETQSKGGIQGIREVAREGIKTWIGSEQKGRRQEKRSTGSWLWWWWWRQQQQQNTLEMGFNHIPYAMDMSNTIQETRRGPESHG